MSEHPNEPHGGSLSQRLNALRAAVLGANDGIVSTAGVVLGVAGATSILPLGLVTVIAVLLAGAASLLLARAASPAPSLVHTPTN